MATKTATTPKAKKHSPEFIEECKSYASMMRQHLADVLPDEHLKMLSAYEMLYWAGRNPVNRFSKRFINSYLLRAKRVIKAARKARKGKP